MKCLLSAWGSDEANFSCVFVCTVLTKLRDTGKKVKKLKVRVHLDNLDFQGQELYARSKCHRLVAFLCQLEPSSKLCKLWHGTSKVLIYFCLGDYITYLGKKFEMMYQITN